MIYRYEVSDRQWDLIAPILAKPTGGRGRPRKPDRVIINAIFWLLNSGSQWRDLPERYGSWKTVYHRFRQLQASGQLDRILTVLQLRLMEDGYIDPDTWMLDGTYLKAHPSAAGGKKNG